MLLFILNMYISCSRFKASLSQSQPLRRHLSFFSDIFFPIFTYLPERAGFSSFIYAVSRKVRLRSTVMIGRN